MFSPPAQPDSTIAFKSDIVGCHFSSAFAREGSATRRAGSPGRGPSIRVRMGTRLNAHEVGRALTSLGFTNRKRTNVGFFSGLTYGPRKESTTWPTITRSIKEINSKKKISSAAVSYAGTREARIPHP